MKIKRVIEEYKKENGENIGTYKLDIETTSILELLDDLVLNEDDYEDEIYDPYLLNKSQVEKLIPYLKDKINLDYINNIYELMCYEESEPTIVVKSFEKMLSMKEFDIETKVIHKSYKINLTLKEILRILDDLVLEDDDTEEKIEGVYKLTQFQVMKLKPFLDDELKENMGKYIYYIYYWDEPIYES